LITTLTGIPEARGVRALNHNRIVPFTGSA
jgi:hypothetical protein